MPYDDLIKSQRMPRAAPSLVSVLLIQPNALVGEAASRSVISIEYAHVAVSYEDLAEKGCAVGYWEVCGRCCMCRLFWGRCLEGCCFGLCRGIRRLSMLFRGLWGVGRSPRTDSSLDATKRKCNRIWSIHTFLPHQSLIRQYTLPITKRIPHTRHTPPKRHQPLHRPLQYPPMHIRHHILKRGQKPLNQRLAIPPQQHILTSIRLVNRNNKHMPRRK